MAAEKPDQSDFSINIADNVATLTFTRPHKANAFHPRMIEPMREFFNELRHRPDVRAVLIRGEGRHFMAGGDLESLGDPTAKSDASLTLENETYIQSYNDMIRVMHQLSQPVVASVQGGAAGAAVGFIGACDLVIAADTAFFWAAHILHGGSNDGLLTYFLPRHVGLRKALEMALLGDRIKAAEAKEIGLVNFVVPETDLAAETNKLMARLAKGPTQGYGKIKRLIYSSFANTMLQQGALEAETYASLVHTSDLKEGLRAFFDGKREPDFKGR